MRHQRLAARRLAARRLAARRRRGAVALEFAIVFPILLIAIVGLVELSRVLMVQQVMINAAREGARRAVVPASNDAELTGENGILSHYLSNAGIPATYTVQVLVNGSPSTVVAASPHDELTVVVSIPYGDVTWGFTTFFAGNANLVAGVTMRKE